MFFRLSMVGVCLALLSSSPLLTCPPSFFSSVLRCLLARLRTQRLLYFFACLSCLSLSNYASALGQRARGRKTSPRCRRFFYRPYLTHPSFFFPLSVSLLFLLLFVLATDRSTLSLFRSLFLLNCHRNNTRSSFAPSLVLRLFSTIACTAAG